MPEIHQYRWINRTILFAAMLLLSLKGVYASEVPVQSLDTPMEVSQMVKEDWEDDYEEDAPYQTKRIIIHSTDVNNYFGEAEKYVYTDGGMTILCFDTEKATKVAYQDIVKIYGQNGCYVDQIISIDDVEQSVISEEVPLEEDEQSSSNANKESENKESENKESENEESKSKESSICSWGAPVLGITNIKSNETIAGKKPIVVAVIDTGISTNSSIFKGKTITSTSYNFADGNKNIEDIQGHGTHVAGIIADLTPDNVQLMILKISDRNGRSSSLVMNLALDYAVKKNVNVINLSYGFLSSNAVKYTFLDNAIDHAYKKGIPVCVSAGNVSPELPGRNVLNCYPACNGQTIAVSALNKNLELAEYSYYGSTIDYAAPGSAIISAGINSDKVIMEGTSMAAPHISAVMAYIKLLNNNISVEGMNLELQKRCVDLGAEGKDSLYGYGYPNISKLSETGLNYPDWTTQSMLATPKIKNCVNIKSGIQLTWTSVTGASQYYVYRKCNEGTYQRIAVVGNSKKSYVDTTVAEGGYVSYYVVAFGKKNGISCSSGRSTVVNQIRLKQPTITRVKSVSKKKINISIKEDTYWSGKKIIVQYSTKKDFKKVVTKTYDAANCSIKMNINKKGNYYVRIRSKYDFQNRKYYSTWSSIKKFKIS